MLLLIAAAPAYAGSGKIRHSGAVVDVPESKVTLRITIKKGRPTKLSSQAAVVVESSSISSSIVVMVGVVSGAAPIAVTVPCTNGASAA